MKRFLIVCAAALAVTAVSGQKASANPGGGFGLKLGVNFGFNVGFKVGFDGGGCGSQHCGFPYAMAPSGYDVGGGGYHDHGYALQGQSWGGNTAYATAPQTAPRAPAAVSAPATQQIGYHYYPSAGYYNAPSYWYGR